MMFKKIPLAFAGAVVMFPVAVAALETSPYQYDPRVGRCTNRQGLHGLKSGFRGMCGDLWGADMKNANLKDVDLSGANLSRADLTGANLTGANLSGASMMLTKIKDARLEGAIFNERTILPFSRQDAEKRGMVFVPRAQAVTPAPVLPENGKLGGVRRRSRT